MARSTPHPQVERSRDDLPKWARDQVPLTHPQACLVLGVSHRKLFDILKDHPFFERRGKHNLYYPEHIAALRAVTRDH